MVWKDGKVRRARWTYGSHFCTTVGELLRRTEEREGVIVSYDSSDGYEAETEGSEEELENFDMFEKDINHSGPFEGICMDRIEDMGIFEEFSDSYLKDQADKE